jgi:hypothetical protein
MVEALHGELVDGQEVITLAFAPPYSPSPSLLGQ